MTEPSYFECITRTDFDTSTLTGSYASLNGSGFSDDIKILKIYNAGTLGIEISYDGVVDHDYFPAGATLIVDLQTNHADNSSNGAGTKYGRKGQVIFGKGTAGTGILYIIGYR